MTESRKQCKGSGRTSGGHGPSSFWLQEPQSVFDHLALQKGMVFVDAGCGAGDYTLHASAILGSGGVVIALDQARQSVEWLNSRTPEPGKAPITALACDITEPLPLQSGIADAAMLGTVLHIRQVRDGAAVLFSEMRRILRPGGVLAVLECKKEEADFGPPLHSRLSPDDVAELVAPQGFKKESDLLLEHTNLTCFRAG
ncbi:class I SAM-dependent methyltransferase [Pseudodesulfovibrio sediminis]|uniref:SAM-dependent methyltransferase n=1 Tax=Pseudodesulfovibrio sediminis TaxID=2810563 RepID=A0ABN6ESJ6_9BACT|nr:class I SAM-dependent methyltransferase [Pseudodesulfovibrio sediminis]BCS88124.1 SAM-dependent methyltransferase [Pseudodesulfovibrio sediminis]